MTSSKDPVPAPIVTSLTKNFESETFEVLIISTTRLSASCEGLNSPAAQAAAELCPNTLAPVAAEIVAQPELQGFNVSNISFPCNLCSFCTLRKRYQKAVDIT